MSLPRFVEKMDHAKPAAAFAFVPIISTSGKNIPIFSRAGCATASGTQYIVVLVIKDARVYVAGYYDVLSEGYTTADDAVFAPASHLDVRGSEHGRYLHNGFPRGSVPSWWPIVTLDDSKSTAWKLAAIHRSKALIVASAGANTPLLVKALILRMSKEAAQTRHLDVKWRHRIVLAQVVSDVCSERHLKTVTCTTAAQLALQGRKPASRLPVGRAVPSACDEPPSFFEPDPR